MICLILLDLLQKFLSDISPLVISFNEISINQKIVIAYFKIEDKSLSVHIENLLNFIVIIIILINNLLIIKHNNNRNNKETTKFCISKINVTKLQ